MAISTAQVLSTSAFGPGAGTNAFLEAFALHARALVGFFFGGKKSTDDIVASDFFADPVEWRRIRGSRGAVLKPISARVGKEIAHLSYVRIRVVPEAKGWDVPAIAAAIANIANRFRDAVAPELLCADWKRGESPPHADA